MQPLVDVVIPTRQRPELTAQALQSVLRQTLPAFHAYVVEDGEEILRGHPAMAAMLTDTRVSLLATKKTSGPAVARNTGASAGRAPFIAFLDSDDLWLPEKLERQITYFAQHADIHYQHCEEIWLRDREPIKPRARHRKQGGFFIQRAFELCLISPSAVMFRRPFWERYGGFAPSFFVAEDYELWLRLNLNFPVGFIETPLVIKQAGAWAQLSSTKEIDRYRVLALHRLWRLEKSNPRLKDVLDTFVSEALRKCSILYKGALKYGREDRAAEYQRWIKVFNRLRTRAIC